MKAANVLSTEEHMTYTVYVLMFGQWEYEDQFPTQREARRYVRNCKFWDALRRRIRTTRTEE